jgi:hypothetical protein
MSGREILISSISAGPIDFTSDKRLTRTATVARAAQSSEFLISRAAARAVLAEIARQFHYHR